MDNPFKSPSVLSLCTGMRGLERGIERAIGSVNTVAYVEIEAFVIENLVRQMEQGVLDPAPVWSNLKTFPSEQFHGKIHGITGGYPCQPFSAAGLRKGTDDPRHLWPFIKSIVKKSRPVWVFFENVEGHLLLGLDVVLKDLRQLGYQTEVGIFSAEEVGAPHRRNRVFILGVENYFLIGMRGWNDEQRENWRCEIQTSGSSELANATIEGLQKSRSSRREFYDRAEQPSDELDDTSINEYEISARRNSIESSSEKLGNSNNSGLEGWYSGISEERSGEYVAGKNGPFFPARPGQTQHEWEAPRIESSLGYAINGYNFREDLLRMAGNGVVEQTAEIAFKILLNKFIK